MNTVLQALLDMRHFPGSRQLRTAGRIIGMERPSRLRLGAAAFQPLARGSHLSSRARTSSALEGGRTNTTSRTGGRGW